MPTLGRKVRIGVEWTWSMFFAADVTHLRFTRSAETESVSTPAIAAGTPATPL
jgi:NADH dehydrogenase